MLGQIEFEKPEGLTKMPQKAASAWAAVDKLIGAKYKPLIVPVAETTALSSTAEVAL